MTIEDLIRHIGDTLKTKVSLDTIKPVPMWNACLDKGYVPVILFCDGKPRHTVPAKETVTYPYNVKGYVTYTITDYKVSDISIHKY